MAERRGLVMRSGAALSSKVVTVVEETSWRCNLNRTVADLKNRVYDFILVRRTNTHSGTTPKR